MARRGGLWFDAHTHIGHHDPDGFEADPEELIAALDAAGQRRALLFAMQEPDGYREPNDWVLRWCAAWDGRLLALGRIEAKAPDALDEAHRVLEAGAAASSCTRAATPSRCPTRSSRRSSRWPRARLPVLFHAGRGIRTSASVVRDGPRHPGARLILAHAGISDLGLIAPHARELPNILFDTSWWHLGHADAVHHDPARADPVRLGHALRRPALPAFLMLRCARAVGLTPGRRGDRGRADRAGRSGDDLLDLGPALGDGRLRRRVLAYERVITYVAAAVQMTFRQGDPTEALSLARLACQAPEGTSTAKCSSGSIACSRGAAAARRGHGPHRAGLPGDVAMVLVGTAEALERPKLSSRAYVCVTSAHSAGCGG